VQTGAGAVAVNLNNLRVATGTTSVSLGAMTSNDTVQVQGLSGDFCVRQLHHRLARHRRQRLHIQDMRVKPIFAWQPSISARRRQRQRLTWPPTPTTPVASRAPSSISSACQRSMAARESPQIRGGRRQRVFRRSFRLTAIFHDKARGSISIYARRSGPAPPPNCPPARQPPRTGPAPPPRARTRPARRRRRCWR